MGTARDKILDACEDLLNKKKLSKISAKEIIEKAGVSKQTFYRYFEDKYAVACGIYDRMMEPILKQYAEDRDYVSFYTASSDMVLRNSELYRSMMHELFEQNSIFMHIAEDCIRILLGQVNKNKITEEMRVELISYVLGNEMLQWMVMSGDLDLDPEITKKVLLDRLPQHMKEILQI